MRKYQSTIAPNYKGLDASVPNLKLISGDLLQSLESAHEEAQRRIKVRFSQSMMAKQGFKKPAFGTAAYREYARKGMISPEEQEADAIMREIRAERTGQRKDGFADLTGSIEAPFPIHKNTPVRWGQQAPIPSDQYTPNMATTAARDDRLTPNAKAFLQLIHARCASDGITETTKATVANIMNRSTRTIQRYIADLVQFGYLTTHIKRNARGLYVGLVMKVTERTKPFYASLKRTAEVISKYFDWGASETDVSLRNLDKTSMSSKKRSLNNIEADSLMADPFD
jgi:hypothetical protein